MRIQQPHDITFRDIFSDPNHARDLLRQILPEKVSDYMDYATLVKEESSFVDQEMKEHHSDMLFSVEGKTRQIKVYLLFEHKSYPDKNIHVQILSYLARIYSQMKDV